MRLSPDPTVTPEALQEGKRALVKDAAWASMVGVSCNFCNAASSAFDARTHSVYIDASPGSLMASITSDGGTLRWYSPVADLHHYESVSTANGVVFTVDSLGFLDAFDADGTPLLHRPLAIDGASETAFNFGSNGVSIARNTVFVAAGNHVLAYR